MRRERGKQFPFQSNLSLNWLRLLKWCSSLIQGKCIKFWKYYRSSQNLASEFFMMFLKVQSPKMQHLLMLKRVYTRKDQSVFFCTKIKTITIVIENVYRDLSHYQVEQMKEKKSVSTFCKNTMEATLIRLINFPYRHFLVTVIYYLYCI